MRTVTLSILLFLSCSGGDIANGTGSYQNGKVTNKDSIHWTTLYKDSIHWTTIPKDSIAWTTIPKDSVKWNIINKDTFLIMPLYL
jgi:hypothetical protein